MATFKSLIISLWLFNLEACHLIGKEKPLESRTETKLYLYSYSTDSGEIDWYCHSSIGGLYGSKLDFCDKRNRDTVTINCFYLSDFFVKDDTLTLQFWKNDTSEVDKKKIPHFKHILFDPTGDQNKNGIEARISRIIDAKIEFTKPHKFNSRYIK